ncbi:uncharacterized protein BDR25DRAFT_354084 [Lindgomyces ingoldianus]|uniref:Uncharacterized protein n=1 Tax=Lindgomyces ingoldianus TaxID=673940 RepID=A0ACB6QXE4_9PLEO|nr:uncharacterized protein BDR25DRAFT_354084 [Lindgomyces ingoldianus]KAF2471555.1 hypothetical protein BDR25DRAFT_354084 [Lindgomyces ingoldianus]
MVLLSFPPAETDKFPFGIAYHREVKKTWKLRGRSERNRRKQPRYESLKQLAKGMVWYGLVWYLSHSLVPPSIALPQQHCEKKNISVCARPTNKRDSYRLGANSSKTDQSTNEKRERERGLPNMTRQKRVGPTTEEREMHRTRGLIWCLLIPANTTGQCNLSTKTKAIAKDHKPPKKMNAGQDI